MSVSNEEKDTETKLVDDIDLSKLQELRAKMAPKIVAKKTRSISFGVVGLGQGGSRLCSIFYKLGYPGVCLNTASQDLDPIEMPTDLKLLLEYGLGGAAREKEIGRAAAETHRDAINELVTQKLGDEQVIVICSSLGGGSGAGSLNTVIDILSDLGKPLVAMVILPMANEDAQVKKNALETLSDLTKEVQSRRLSNLIVIDNAKIEAIYSDVGQFDFFNVSNQAIVEPLDAFNTFSSMQSSVKGLDPSEFGKILLDGNGLTVYGQLTVANYTEDTAIAEAIISNLNSGLLAGGFDLKHSRYVGVLIIANKKTWAQIPSSSVNYAMAMVQDQCGVPSGVFRGIYSSEDIKEDVVKVYSIFSGLGLPKTRIEQLQKESAELSAKTKSKDDDRNLNLKIDTGADEINAVDKIKNKIALKKSAFGSLVSSTVDRRKK